MMYINVDLEKIPKYTKIVGVSFYDRQSNVRLVDVGDYLSLKRDYYNQHDKNAIGFYTKEDKHLCWVPRSLAKMLAPEIDNGIIWIAKIINITGLDFDTQGINVELICTTEFDN